MHEIILYRCSNYMLQKHIGRSCNVRPSRDHQGSLLNLCKLLLIANQMCTHARQTGETVARRKAGWICISLEN